MAQDIIQEYPKMVYKSRTDYIVVEDLEQHEAAAEKGYGEFEIVVLKQKPQSVIEDEAKAETEKADKPAKAEKSKAK